MIKDITYKELSVHILVWVCISIFPFFTAYQALGEIPKYLYFRLLLHPILFYANYLVFVPYFLLKRKLFLYIIISIAFLIAINVIREILISNPIGEGLRKIPKPEDMPGGPFRFRHAIPIVFSLAIFLLGGIFSLVVDFYKRDSESKKLENEHKEVKLQSLRNQLNPHFLFNSLNSIYSLVRSKSNDAPEAVITLSELMRYMLYEARDEQVPLEKEINYIKNYIALQRLRLKNSEAVKLNINGETRNLKIYPLLLISFIENAFKYGTDYEGNTHIDIKIKVLSNKLIFDIENIIGLYRRDEKNSGVGLKNIKNQLKHLYSNNHVLTIEEDESKYKVHLTINLKNNEVYNN